MGKSINENFKEFNVAGQEYIEASIAFHKLDLFKKTIKGVISGSYKLIIAFFFLTALIFLSVAAAIFIGEMLESVAIGYLIVGGFYLLLMLILSLFLKPFLEKTILRSASKQFFNDKNDKLKIEEYENL